MSRGQALIEEVLEREETQFRRTLDKGLRLLDEATGDMGEGGTLDGETAFKLYDTYGFPYDLTEDALRARGIGVDREGFDAAMARAEGRRARGMEGIGRGRQRAKSGSTSPSAKARPNSPAIPRPTGEAGVVAIVKDGAEVASKRARATRSSS